MNLNFSLINFNRAIVKIKTNRAYSVKSLIDTGSYIPVWCDSEEEFFHIYPKAYYSGYVTFIGGFGKGKETSTIYIIPDFVFSDGTNTVHYKNFAIALLEKSFAFQMILGYGIFTKSNLSFNNYTNKPNYHTIDSHVLVSYPRDIIFTKLNVRKDLDSKTRYLLSTKNIKGIIDDVIYLPQK